MEIVDLLKFDQTVAFRVKQMLPHLSTHSDKIIDIGHVLGTQDLFDPRKRIIFTVPSGSAQEDRTSNVGITRSLVDND